MDYHAGEGGMWLVPPPPAAGADDATDGCRRDNAPVRRCRPATVKMASGPDI